MVIVKGDESVKAVAELLRKHHVGQIQRPLCLIREDNSLLDALGLMRNQGIRRLPVVDANKALTGIITIDDVTELLTEMLGLVTGVIKRQQKQEITRMPLSLLEFRFRAIVRG